MPITKWDVLNQRNQRRMQFEAQTRQEEMNRPTTAEAIGGILLEGVKLTDTIGMDLAQNDATTYLQNMSTWVLQGIEDGSFYTDDEGNILTGDALIENYDNKIRQYMDENPVGKNPWKNRIVNDGIQTRRENDLERIVVGTANAQNTERNTRITAERNRLRSLSVSNTSSYAEQTLLNFNTDYDSLSDSEKSFFDNAGKGSYTDAMLLSESLYLKSIGVPQYEINNYLETDRLAFQNIEWVQDVASSYDINVARGSMTKDAFLTRLQDDLESGKIDIWDDPLNEASITEKMALAKEKVDELHSAKTVEVENMFYDIIDYANTQFDVNPNFLLTTNAMDRLISSNPEWEDFNINYLDMETKREWTSILQYNDSIASMNPIRTKLKEINNNPTLSTEEKEIQKLTLFGSVNIPDTSSLFDVFDVSKFKDMIDTSDMKSRMMKFNVTYSGDNADLSFTINNADSFGYLTQLKAEIELYRESGYIGPTLAVESGYTGGEVDSILAEKIGRVEFDTIELERHARENGYTQTDINNATASRKNTMKDSFVKGIEENIAILDVGYAMKHNMSAKATSDANNLVYNNWKRENREKASRELNVIDENIINDTLMSAVSHILEREVDRDAVKSELTGKGLGEAVQDGTVDKILDNIIGLTVDSGEYVTYDNGLYRLQQQSLGAYRASIINYTDNIIENYGNVELSDGKTISQHFDDLDKLFARLQQEEVEGFGIFTEESDPEAWARSQSILSEIYTISDAGGQENKRRAMEKLTQARELHQINEDQYEDAIRRINNPGLKVFEDADFDIQKHLEDTLGLQPYTPSYDYVIQAVASAVNPSMPRDQMISAVNTAANEAISEIRENTFFENEDNKLTLIYDDSLEKGNGDKFVKAIIDGSSRYAYTNFSSFVNGKGDVVPLNMYEGIMQIASMNLQNDELLLDIILSINRNEMTDNGPARTDYSDEDIVGLIVDHLFGVAGDYVPDGDNTEFWQRFHTIAENMNPDDLDLLTKTTMSLFQATKTTTILREDYPFDIKDYDYDAQYYITENGAYIRPMMNESGRIVGMYATWDPSSDDWDYIESTEYFDGSRVAYHGGNIKSREYAMRHEDNVKLLEEYSGKRLHLDTGIIFNTINWR